MYILAHRGYPVEGLPENTLPAFKKALDLGADGFELDVHLSKDQHLIVYHDNSFEKVGVNQRVKDLYLDEIKKIKLSNEIVIPTLNEVLETFGNRTFINIEIKDRRAAPAVVKVLNDYNINLEPHNVLVSSFHQDTLLEIKKLKSRVPTGFLTVFPWRSLKRAKQLNCNAIHPFYNQPPHYWQKLLIALFTERLIKKSLNQSLNVNLWTVNNSKYIKTALKMGVTSIITDKVVNAIRIKKEKEK